MIEIINFFNKNAGGIQAFSSILILIVTFIYVVINSRMHQEMVKTRQKSETPEINFRLKKVRTGYYNLVIENISNVPAYNLIFRKCPALKLADNITTADIGFFKHGIKYFAPQQQYESFFLDYRDRDNQMQTIEFEIEYENKEKHGKKYSQYIAINLSIFFNRMDFGNSPEEMIVEELRAIKDSLKNYLSLPSYLENINASIQEIKQKKSKTKNRVVK